MTEMISNMLISSKYRDRILFPNPCQFSVSTNSPLNENSLFTSRNPTTDQYPVYNFSFPKKDFVQFASKILSISSTTIVLDENIFDLIGHVKVPNTSKITFKNAFDCINILKGFFIEIKIADSTFYREIVSFSPTDSSVELASPFPFVMNESSEISCFITNRQSSGNELTCNGPFFQNNDFLYHQKLHVYNIKTDEFRSVTKRNRNILTLSSEFSSTTENDQYLLFNSNTVPNVHGQLLFQENHSLHSLQYGRLNFIQNGSGYKNKMKIIFLPNDDAYDSNVSYHEYQLVNLQSDGKIQSTDNIELVKLGGQVLSTGTVYQLYSLDTSPTLSCTLSITNLVSCFTLSSLITDIGSTENLIGNYFFPLLLSNQYSYTNSELYVQPNNSFSSNTYNNKLKLKNISDFESHSAVFPIQKAYVLENGYTAIKTNLVKNLERIHFVDNQSFDSNNIVSYQGIYNFIILNYSGDGIKDLDIPFIKKGETYKIILRNIVLPNLSIVNSMMKTTDLPYILLNIDNKTKASNMNNNNIQSNNPNVSKNKFILYINEDIDKNLEFIKLSCDSCQAVEFNPYDNLELTFRLPNGQLIEFEKQENILPKLSNDKLELVIFLEIISKKK